MANTDTVAGRVLDLFRGGPAIPDVAAVRAGSAMMTQAIPLGGLLRIKMVDIVKGDALSNPMDLMMESLTPEPCVVSAIGIDCEHRKRLGIWNTNLVDQAY